MHSSVLQIFATCLHSNTFLGGDADQPVELLGSHSTYRSVHSVAFERTTGLLREGVIADRVAPWLRKLMSESVQCLRPVLKAAPLRVTNDSSSVWGIVSDGDRGLEIWRPDWRVRVAGRDDPSPFHVTYAAERASWNLLSPLGPASEWSGVLESSLRAAKDLAVCHGDAIAATAAQRCLKAHLSRGLDTPGFEDLIPERLGFSLRALGASAVRTTCLLQDSEWIRLSSHHKPEFEPINRNLWQATLGCMESVVGESLERHECLAS